MHRFHLLPRHKCHAKNYITMRNGVIIDESRVQVSTSTSEMCV